MITRDAQVRLAVCITMSASAFIPSQGQGGRDRLAEGPSCLQKDSERTLEALHPPGCCSWLPTARIRPSTRHRGLFAHPTGCGIGSLLADTDPSETGEGMKAKGPATGDVAEGSRWFDVGGRRLVVDR